MLNSKRFKEEEGLVATAADKPHLYTSAGFQLKLNNTITLNPSMLYRMEVMKVFGSLVKLDGLQYAVNPSFIKN